MTVKNHVTRVFENKNDIWRVFVFSKDIHFNNTFSNSINTKEFNGYLVNFEYHTNTTSLIESIPDSNKVIIHINTDEIEELDILKTIYQIRDNNIGEMSYVVLWGKNPWNKFPVDFVKKGLVNDVFCNLCVDNKLTHILNTNIRNQIDSIKIEDFKKDIDGKVKERTSLLNGVNIKLESELISNRNLNTKLKEQRTKNEQQTLEIINRSDELELAFKKSSKQHIKFHKVLRDNELQRDDLQMALTEIQSKNDALRSQNEEIIAQRDHIEQQREEIQSQRDMALHQRDTIIEQQNEIKDNIAYASKIQYALLPPKELIGQLLPEYFVFNLPKDVVSGDFYWISQNRQKTVIAVADCTGHGISGSMMSMLGTAFLNEIVNKDNVTNSSDVLEQLRKRVISSLHQSITDEISYSHDGMDISICIIDILENTIEYSGANNPLYLYRNNELIEFSPDKMPIGIHDYFEEPFHSEKRTLQAGDSIYMFSDGFPDQFGGEKDKKYKYPKFKNILNNLSNIPCAQRSEELKIEFESWKGENDQIDDVLILGFDIL